MWILSLYDHMSNTPVNISGYCDVAGLQAELAAAHKESEFMRRRLRQLEEDLGSFKQKNTELQDELQKRAGAVHHMFLN